ncbi:MAG: response regulator, partial [Gammaproteobacteria bacterium]|nr:response regulator [Gammaproteobacteria bacterium]
MKPDTQILLVEDEAPVRDVWRRYLQRWAYTHEIVPNAEEALALARRRRFDLVITDLAMPGMSGQALLTTLKAEQPELAVIVVTGFGTVQVAVEIMKAGAYDFITKPINFVHAELVVKNCLEQLRVQRESVRLQKVAADLEALNELKEKFIAITNHELRTPVGIIRSVAELLRAEDDGGELGMLVDILARASGQLTEIVSQMHEISSVKSD